MPRLPRPERGSPIRASDQRDLVRALDAERNAQLLDTAEADTSTVNPRQSQRPPACLDLFELTSSWRLEFTEPYYWHAALARRVRYGSGDKEWSKNDFQDEVRIWHPGGYPPPLRDTMRLDPKMAIMPRFDDGDWVWCTFNAQSGRWEVLGAFEDIWRFVLTEPLAACGEAEAKLWFNGNDCNPTCEESNVCFTVYDPVGVVNSAAFATTSGVPAGTLGYAKYFADEQWFEVLALGNCQYSSSGESSSGQPSSSGQSSGSGSSSGSSSGDCDLTTTVTVLTGLTRVGDNVCASRVVLDFRNGLLCTKTPAAPVCVYICCSDSSSSSGVPSSSGESSSSSSGDYSCDPGYCVWEWDSGGNFWSIVTDECTDLHDRCCQCGSAPFAAGDYDGQQAVVSCIDICGSSSGSSGSSSACQDVTFDSDDPGEFIQQDGFCDDGDGSCAGCSAGVLRLGDVEGDGDSSSSGTGGGSFSCTKRFGGLEPGRTYYVRIWGKRDEEADAVSSTLSFSVGTASLELDQDDGPMPAGCACDESKAICAGGTVTADVNGNVYGYGSATAPESICTHHPLICCVEFLCEDPGACPEWSGSSSGV